METIINIWTGRAGLAKTYWGYGVGGAVVWALLLSLVTPGTTGAKVAVLLFCLYFILVNICVWRAASQYEGATTWAALAKVMAAVAIAIIVTVLAMVVAAIQRGDVPA